MADDVLSAVFVAAAVYEWTAIRWRRWPTITAIVKALPDPLFWAVVTFGVLAWIDHFVVGWVL